MANHQASGEHLPWPRAGDPGSLLAWAKALVQSLSRRFVQTEAVVTKVVEETIDPLVEDQTQALEAMQNYAAEVEQQIADAGGVAQGAYNLYQQAAAARHASLAQHYLTEAVARLEQHVRRSEDEVRAQQINTVAAYLAGSSATIETIEQAVATGQQSVAQQISTVASQAQGNSAAIIELAESVDGIAARWGVAVDLNGHVIGLVQLSGDISGSTFVVVADKFVISHPSASGTTITPFVVGLVDGVSTVAINGNLIVDGSILARHLNVGTLSAISANIGTVTAGKLQSADEKFVIDLDNKTIEILPEDD